MFFVARDLLRRSGDGTHLVYFGDKDHLATEVLSVGEIRM